MNCEAEEKRYELTAGKMPIDDYRRYLKRNFYDTLCRVLCEYETKEARITKADLYETLLFISRNWDDLTND